ncbi:acyltransferase family protein [Serratia symbiotica]|uniref:Acyltransferase n=1 Tax=Serratia symbiotica TaxID=138074 RepID=A0A068ZCM0_9GAMM|nr:acyltransferase family protein [Serratia symbiotica]MBF1994835.1 acyltransferase family protein [Serratia symbiotica]MBQ0954468.1 acyltransferase family protein [Serratia symbiotica]QLH63524.1 acyltransferase [Serratia symbiotica]QTP13917.1 acyltransferase family protein [Serratia symbiotica]CDS58842.1 conserved membrane hypothetical protein [Serratia symbiotica]
MLFQEEEGKVDKQRNISLDIIKVVMAYCVVLLHQSAFYMVHHSADEIEAPAIRFILENGLFRIAVPFFLVVSGYFFVKINNFSGFVKWCLRVGKLYVFWSLCYMLLCYYFNKFPAHWTDFIFGYMHLWYLLGTLLGGTLLWFMRKVTIRNLLLVAFLIYFLGLIIQEVSLCNFIKGPVGIYLSSTPVARNFFFFCFPIMSLGYAISKTNYDGKYHKNGIMLILALVLVACESYAQYIFVGYKSIDVMLMTPIAAALLFIYFKNMDITINSNYKLLVPLFSTAIYLGHWAVLLFLQDVDFFTQIIIVTILSLILVFLHRWVKFIL